MNRPIANLSASSASADFGALDPARLIMLAGGLDAAGDACSVLAARTARPTSRVHRLARASACYGAAKLLRKIAL